MTASAPGVYTHSGKLGFGLVVVPIGALVSSLGLSIVYAYIDVYTPIVAHVTLFFIVVFVFPCAVGWSVSILGYVARCRSSGFLHLAGLFAGLLALYGSWAAFEYALLSSDSEGLDVSLLTVLLSPGAVWEVAKAINQEGWYSIAEMTPKGAVLWVVWAIEAVIIVGLSTLLAGIAIDRKVFCEECTRWCTITTDAVLLGAPEDTSQLADLRLDNLDALVSLDTVPESHSPQIRLDTWQCTKCNNTGAVQAKLWVVTTDQEGERQYQSETLPNIWSLTPAAMAQLHALAARSPIGDSEEVP